MKRWFIIGYWAILALLFFPSIPSMIETWSLKAFEQKGGAMKPTTSEGDFLLVDCKCQPDTIQRFDIVCFWRKETQTVIVQRIIGLPLETVSIQQNQIHINDARLVFPEPISALFTNVMLIPKPCIPHPHTLGANEYYLLGDNVGNSLDSRFFGSVASSDIVGRVVTTFTPDAPPLWWILISLCILMLAFVILISLYPVNLSRAGHPLWHRLPLMGIGAGISIFFIGHPMFSRTPHAYLAICFLMLIPVYAWAMRLFIYRRLQQKAPSSTGRLMQALTITLVGIAAVLLFVAYKIWIKYD